MPSELLSAIKDLLFNPVVHATVGTVGTLIVLVHAAFLGTDPSWYYVAQLVVMVGTALLGISEFFPSKAEPIAE